MRKREKVQHPEDLTRERQYRGVDPSGYERAPSAGQGWVARQEWREPSPGNYGEAGGRWHDHEMPFEGGRREVGLGMGSSLRSNRAMPEGGFRDHPTELWPGAPGGGYAYGHGGREGHSDPASGRNANPIGQPRGEHVGRGPRGYKRSDERIREDVCDRMMEHGELDARGVDVTVRDGEVILEGTVDSRPAKRLAEDLAASVSGVRDVMNQLRIRRDEPRADATHPEEAPERGRRNGHSVPPPKGKPH